jgi:hypothetical protein
MADDSPAGVDVPPPPPPIVDTVLTWIGFNIYITRDHIRADGFDTFDNLATMKENDIRNLAESYGRCSFAACRAVFGLRRIRYLIGLIHWDRASEELVRSQQLKGLRVRLCSVLLSTRPTTVPTSARSKRSIGYGQQSYRSRKVQRRTQMARMGAWLCELFHLLFRALLAYHCLAL